jgi:hypothetical protein
MNDFDRFLEIELRRILDPVASAPAPTRRRRKGLPLLAVMAAPLELAAGAISAVEPAVVPVPVARG